ncbi:hypothetical protein G9A89_001776 [Geosiphon pyriformis]|nr:hypothetical protein G9A89_001776 [Geosiphon pyriformis]
MKQEFPTFNFSKKLLSSLFLIFHIIIYFYPPQIAGQCLKPSNAGTKENACKFMADIKPILSLRRRHSRKNNNSTANFRKSTTKMFQINFNCGIKDKKLCQKAENSFEVAGNYITSVLTLQVPIKVNATFYSFCEDDPESCKPGMRSLIGGAYPSNLMPMRDQRDGRTRFYPQSLVKQFNFTRHREYTEFDIEAIFNSNFEFWFPTDNTTTIKTGQIDFSFVVLHELVHGLGFYSVWRDHINEEKSQWEALTPKLCPDTEISCENITFVESVFDQYIEIIPENNQRLSSYVPLLNKFSKEKAGSLEPLDFYPKFKASIQYKIAKDLFKYAVQNKSLAFRPDIYSTQVSSHIILETSLTPYQPTSSVLHVDKTTYEKTLDFLMIFELSPGKTLSNLIVENGGGPIGPNLKAVLEMLGYTTKEQPNPNHIPTPI